MRTHDTGLSVRFLHVSQEKNAIGEEGGRKPPHKINGEAFSTESASSSELMELRQIGQENRLLPLNSHVTKRLLKKEDLCETVEEHEKKYSIVLDVLL